MLFRGKLLGAIEAAIAAGQLKAPAGLDVRRALKRSARKKWTVYAKPSFTGPDDVIRYLGRYTHRIAITNGRLVSLTNGEVTFRYKDRAAGGIPRTMTIPANQFLRRFLLHVLPLGFVRIRYFGGLAHCNRRAWLDLARYLLAKSDAVAPTTESKTSTPESWQELLFRLTGVDVTRCPRCKSGRLELVETIEPGQTLLRTRIDEAPT